MNNGIDQAENLLAELTGNSTTLPPVAQLTAEIKLLTRQTVDNLIEIGHKLIQAKKQLPHGDWGRWLEEEVQFSHQHANRLMKLSEECPNSSTLRNLAPSKAFMMLSMPAEERENFVEQPHKLPTGETKKVDEMTARELSAAIQAQKNAEARATKAEQELELAYGATNVAREHAHGLSETIKRLEKQLEERPQKEVPKVPADYATLKNQAAEANKLSVALNDLRNQKTILENQLKAYQEGKPDERLSLQLNVDILEANAKEYILKAAPMVFLVRGFQTLPPDCQKKVETSVEMLEQFCSDMRDNMIRPNTKDVYDLEVIRSAQ